MDTIICWSCGAEIPAKEAIKTDAALPGRGGDVWQCPRCFAKGKSCVMYRSEMRGLAAKRRKEKK